jgi:hypothetical protein
MFTPEQREISDLHGVKRLRDEGRHEVKYASSLAIREVIREAIRSRPIAPMPRKFETMSAHDKLIKLISKQRSKERHDAGSTSHDTSTIRLLVLSCPRSPECR